MRVPVSVLEGLGAAGLACGQFSKLGFFSIQKIDRHSDRKEPRRDPNFTELPIS